MHESRMFDDYHRIQRSIDFVESHLGEDIGLE